MVKDLLMGNNGLNLVVLEYYYYSLVEANLFYGIYETGF